MKDPSAPLLHEYRINEPSAEDIRSAIDTAREDPEGWGALSIEERAEIFTNVAANLRAKRGELVARGVSTAGKMFVELDAEVSEAIDFIEYYVRSALEVAQQGTMKPKGVGAVIAPWNFPVAIPIGGTAGSLISGNRVLLKPSPEGAFVADMFVKEFHSAGVPVSALQCLPCGDEKSAFLASQRDLDFIVFTGGTATARAIQANNPRVPLFAETGGKNATIVSAMADREQAIKHMIRSAFSSAGQKCSATSLAILVGAVYDDPQFQKQLQDAVESVIAGSAWDFSTEMGPLINAPNGPLARAISQLKDGEKWLVEPRQPDGSNPHLLTPGVKWGVQPGNHDHRNELFGPMLAVMRARDLEEAIEIANATGYGLTSGLESLDEREQELWKERIIAGNLYINKPTTGAIVGRQPFGGMRNSAVGAGIKAGGPNYVKQFMQFTPHKRSGIPSVEQNAKYSQLISLFRAWTERAAQSGNQEIQLQVSESIAAAREYIAADQQYFSEEHDGWNIRGEDNILRFQPVGNVVVRVHPEDSAYDTLTRISAALASGNEVLVSISEGQALAVEHMLTESGLEIVREDDATLGERITNHGVRIRFAHPDRVPDSILTRAAEKGVHIPATVPVSDGRFELSVGGNYNEQSVSNRFHRYGNLLHRS